MAKKPDQFLREQQLLEELKQVEKEQELYPEQLGAVKHVIEKYKEALKKLAEDGD